MPLTTPPDPPAEIDSPISEIGLSWPFGYRWRGRPTMRSQFASSDAGEAMVHFLFRSMSVILIILGLYILIMGRRRSGEYPSCGACDGDLSQTLGSSPNCAMCGVPLARAGIVPPGPRAPRRVRVLGLLAAGAGLCDWIIGICISWAVTC
jgi:hypothetical protein